MSNNRSDSLDRSVGELWVELSRDDKKKICDALIDGNKPDVMQEFATLVRFTRGYLRQQPNGLLSSPKGSRSGPVPSSPGSQRSDTRVEKRKNEEAPVKMPDTPQKRPRKVAVKKKPAKPNLLKSDSDQEPVKEEDDGENWV